MTHDPKAHPEATGLASGKSPSELQFLGQAIEGMSLAMAVFELRGEPSIDALWLVAVNHYAEAMLGQGSLHGRRLSEFFPHLKPSTAGAILSVLQTGEPAALDDVVARAPEIAGRVFTGHFFALGATHLGIFFLDVTQEHRQRTLILRAAEELREHYDDAPVALHSLDQDGRYMHVNQTELALLGYERSELLGARRFGELLTTASRDAFDAHFAALRMPDAVTRSLRLTLLRHDGSELEVLCSSRPLLDEQGRFLGCRNALSVLAAGL